MDKEECIIRIYVVRGIDLQPKDSNGKVQLEVKSKAFCVNIKYICFFIQSDPYIQIELGKIKLDNRDEYIPNSTEPDFGR